MNSYECLEVLNLSNLDKSSLQAYDELISEINARESRRGSFTISIVKALVSRNRLRYKDGDFNLDLSYITKRVIAMGYPGSGFYGLYRNRL